MAGRRRLSLVLGLLGTLVLIGAAGFAALVELDFRLQVERLASRALDRRLAIGALHVGWGNPVALELRDVRLANVPGGSEPEMLTIAALAADIELWPLLRGVVRYDRLRVDTARLLLERKADGGSNWQFGSGGGSGWGGLQLVPKNRTQFPTLLDMALHGGTLVYRVPKHGDLRIGLDDLAIRSSGEDQPVSVALTGSYNGIAARFSATTGSFATMRNGAAPYPAELSLTAQPATFHFNGTLVDPLDFDGVKGTLDMDAPQLGRLLEVFGAGFRFDAGLHLAGAFDKSGDRWHLGSATGALASSTLTGTIELNEGMRGKPDALAGDLAFPVLELKPLRAAAGDPSAPPTPLAATSLRVDDNPGVTIDARIAAQRLTDGNFRLDDFAFAGGTRPGEASVSALSFTLAGGRVTAAGWARSVPQGSHVGVEIMLSGGDADQLVRLLGGAAGQLAGRLDGGVELEMTGATFGGALPTAGGQAVVAMTGGRIARSLIEKASTDLHALFETANGTVAATCLLAVADAEKGGVTLSPLRLRTPDTTLVGGGTVDLVSQRLDLTLKAEGAGPSIFALEVPLKATGTIGNLSIRPLIGSDASWLDAPSRNIPAQHLASALQPLVAGSSCLR